MLSLTVLFYIVLIISTLFLVHDVYSIIRLKTLKIFNVFCIMYVLIHGYLLTYFLTYMEEHPSDTYYLNHHIQQLEIWALLSLLLFVVIRIVYYNSKKRKLIYYRSQNKEDKTQSLAFILLLIGALSFILWAHAYGGIIRLILMADYIRAGQAPVNNGLAFMLHPTRVLLFSTLLFVLLVKRGTRKWLNIFLLICSSVLSILLLLAMDGRFMAAMFFVMLFFCAADIFGYKKITRKKLIYIGAFGVIALLFISVMDSITEIIRLGEISEDYIPDTPFLIREFSFVIESGAFSVDWKINHPDVFMFFDDLITGAFAWFPTAFKPEGFTTIWQYNSHLQAGSSIILAETPCEMVSTSIYDFGFIGFLFFGIFWGKIMAYIDNKFAEDQSCFSVALYCYLSYIFIRLSTYCQLYDVIKDLFPVFVAWIIWLFLNPKTHNNYQIKQ